MLINVTPKHIANGTESEPEFCAIALAIKEKIKEPIVWVSSTHVILGTKENSTRVPLPIEVCDFIDEFDNDGIVKPFSFELEIP